jgi:hypothetical protein
MSVTKTGGFPVSFGYDAYGNMTADGETGIAATTMAYDLGNKLTPITPSTGPAITFEFDALGRFAYRWVAGSVPDIYSYVGGTETVARIEPFGGTTTDSLVSPAGDRLGVKRGSTLNWFLPDPHGNIAGSLDAPESTVVNAIRYDAYGQAVLTGTAGGTAVGATAWKYQGRLDIGPAGSTTPLYTTCRRASTPRASARSPSSTRSLGTWT